jgi:hypothetical protein
MTIANRDVIGQQNFSIVVNCWSKRSFMKIGMILLAFWLFAPGSSCRSTGSGSGSPLQGKQEILRAGVWGGQHIRAEVSERGAEIEFDCARGTIPKQITLDSSHEFDISGTFTAEHGGPVRDDEANTGRPARYKGSVEQQELTLTISDVNTKEVIGTFTLKFGNESRLMKCR